MVMNYRKNFFISSHFSVQKYLKNLRKISYQKKFGFFHDNNIIKKKSKNSQFRFCLKHSNHDNKSILFFFILR